jgi:hypothetical protein
MGAATEAEYLAMADAFLGGPIQRGTTECVRASNADRLRFNQGTQRFGVLTPANVVRTFYKLTPPPRDGTWFAEQCLM